MVWGWYGQVNQGLIDLYQTEAKTDTINIVCIYVYLNLRKEEISFDCTHARTHARVFSTLKFRKLEISRSGTDEIVFFFFVFCYWFLYNVTKLYATAFDNFASLFVQLSA